MTSAPFATESAEDRESAIEAASLAIQRGQLIVLPTDTVYGIAADAFDADAVAALLAAKGRGRQMPPPVLVASPTMLEVLAVDVPPHVGHVDVDVPGTAVRLRVHVPRVRWALRSGRPERLTLASDVIETDPDALLTDDVRLLVRCGREAAVELRLHVDGRPLQVGRRARTGGPHQ